MYIVSQKKLCHSTFVHNFDRRWPIFKIFSLLYSPRNLQQNSCRIAHHILDVSLHYLAECKRRKLAKFYPVFCVCVTPFVFSNCHFWQGVPLFNALVLDNLCEYCTVFWSCYLLVGHKWPYYCSGWCSCWLFLSSLLLVRLWCVCFCDTLAYQKALSFADDTQRPLIHVALAMCSYTDGDVDGAKTYLLPLWVYSALSLMSVLSVKLLP